MPDKPTTAVGYGPEFLERARRTCLHVATVIGDMKDEVVPWCEPREELRPSTSSRGLGRR